MSKPHTTPPLTQIDVSQPLQPSRVRDTKKESPPKAPAEPLPSRHCADCGKSFEPTRHWAQFCCLACQTHFHDVMAKRGKVAIPLLLAMRSGKRGRTDDSAYAFQQLCALADMWIAEDALQSRDAMKIVRRKRKEGWVAADVR